MTRRKINPAELGLPYKTIDIRSIEIPEEIAHMDNFRDLLKNCRCKLWNCKKLIMKNGHSN